MSLLRDDAVSNASSRKQRRWENRWVALGEEILAGLLGAWIGVSIAGTTETHLGPLAIDASITPSIHGQTVLQIDPLGTLIFDTHFAPLEVTVDVRSVEPEALEQIVADPESLNGLEEQLRADLDDALRLAAVRALLVALIGAVVIGGLMLRSARRALIAGGVGLGVLLGSYGLVFLTFDRSAFEEPRFTGLISTAPQLVGTVEAITTDFSDYTRQLATLVTNVSRTYQAVTTLPTFAPTEDAIRVLHVSDLHLNPAAWPVIDAVSEQYEVDVIVDSGDITDHGTAPESRFVEGIAMLDVPYLYVKGNHDSVLTAAAIAEQPDAFTLNNEIRVIEGIRFYGAPDPRFTPNKATSGIADEQILEGTEEVAQALHERAVPPDVLIYHDPTHANLFEGAGIPLVLSGHMHSRDVIEFDDGMRVLVQGSTGGAGLRGLQYGDPTPVSLSVLYFDPETKRLTAWDDITLGGFGLRSAEVQRHQIESPDAGGEEDEESDEIELPSPLPTATTTPTTATTPETPTTSPDATESP